MFTIPLKNSSGTLTLLENGLLEIKKVDMITLISKGSMNRVNINTEGKIVIYQSNTTYSTDYEIRVDKCHIQKVYEMMNIYMGDHSDRDLADIYVKLNKLSGRIDKIVNIDSEIQSSIEIMKDYRSSISMLSSQLVMMTDFNIENIQRIDEKFVTVNKMINSIQADINTVNTSPIVYEEFELPTNNEEDSVTPVIEPAKAPLKVKTCTMVWDFIQIFMLYILISAFLVYTAFTMIIHNKIDSFESTVSYVPSPTFESPIYGLISNENDTLEAF